MTDTPEILSQTFKAKLVGIPVEIQITAYAVGPNEILATATAAGRTASIRVPIGAVRELVDAADRMLRAIKA